MVNADYAETLSAGCTIAHLKKQEPRVQELLAEAYGVVDAFIVTQFHDLDVARTAIEGYKLSDALLTLQVTVDKVLEIDAKLKEFPNDVCGN